MERKCLVCKERPVKRTCRSMTCYNSVCNNSYGNWLDFHKHKETLDEYLVRCKEYWKKIELVRENKRRLPKYIRVKYRRDRMYPTKKQEGLARKEPRLVVLQTWIKKFLGERLSIYIIKDNQEEIERYKSELLKFRTNHGYPDKVIENNQTR